MTSQLSSHRIGLTVISLSVLWFTTLSGCRSSETIAKNNVEAERSRRRSEPPTNLSSSANDADADLELVSFDFVQAKPDASLSDAESNSSASGELAADALTPPDVDDELPGLEALAQSNNPKLLRLQQEANAASAKTRYVDKLPDPTLGANVFGHPIETAAGSQRANLSLMQMIPWMDRLNAQQQQACFEATALRQMYAAERLRVIGDLRAGYYRLYILRRQIEAIDGNQELLESLIEIVNARVATGKATQGDVLLGTLELSRLAEQLITLRQQARSTESEINRLLNREAGTSVAVPQTLSASAIGWTHASLVEAALIQQPVIAAAQLQANATRWGIEVAELRRRPDFHVGASWFFVDNNRPLSNVVNVGRDAWSVGATVSLPLDRCKYDAIRDEAVWKHAASHANADEVRQEFNTRLLDLLEQAKAAQQTARLYRDTIIPQSEQTLNADQEALTDGGVEFDRVIQDFRNLLTLQFGYHRAVGQYAISIARIQQAVGSDAPPVLNGTTEPDVE